MTPHFRNGYDKYLDITEDEWLEQLLDRADDLDDPILEVDPISTIVPIEGEPYEDTYFPGIPDYDRFGRPAWGTEED